VKDIHVMKRRVRRLTDMAQCLELSVLPAVGVEQTDQLSAMSSELDAMEVTCVDRMLLSQPPNLHHDVCLRCSLSSVIYYPLVLYGR